MYQLKKRYNNKYFKRNLLISFSWKIFKKWYIGNRSTSASWDVNIVIKRGELGEIKIRSNLVWKLVQFFTFIFWQKWWLGILKKIVVQMILGFLKNSGTNDLQHKITYFWCKQISPDQKCVKVQFVIQEK